MRDHETPANHGDGRCWARTSDLRLVETERHGEQKARQGTIGQCFQGFAGNDRSLACLTDPSVAQAGAAVVPS